MPALPLVPNRIGAFNYLFATNTETGIVARAGGGQTNATALVAQLNRVDTVASSADSVALPKIVSALNKPGSVGFMTVIHNNTANAMQLFGATPDTINGVATGTGISIPAGQCVLAFAATFVSSTNIGEWIVQKTDTTTTYLPLAGGAMTGTINYGNVAYPLKLNVGAALAPQAPVFTIGAMANFANVNSGAPVGQEDNTVAVVGWNLQAGSGRLDTSKPAMGLSFEQNYRQGGTQAYEFHITVFDTSGTEHRPLSFFLPRDGGTGSTVSTQSDQWGFSTYSDPANPYIQFLLLNPTLDLLRGTYIRQNINNIATAKQRNAANTAFLNLPFLGDDDRVHAEQSVSVVGATPTTGTYANVFAALQATTMPVGGTLLNGVVGTVAGDVRAFDFGGSPLNDFTGRIYNQRNVATANAVLDLFVVGTGAGDPKVTFTVNGGTQWQIGLDNSDSAKFKWGTGAALGSSDKMTLDTSGNLTLAGVFAQSLATPASATATGTAGTVEWDTGFIYVCTAANTWKRVAIATW